MATSDTNNYLELETETGDTIKVWRRAHPRARRLRLTVTSGGARVSYPEGTHPAQVFAFLRKHEAYSTMAIFASGLPMTMSGMSPLAFNSTSSGTSAGPSGASSSAPAAGGVAGVPAAAAGGSAGLSSANVMAGAVKVAATSTSDAR